MSSDSNSPVFNSSSGVHGTGVESAAEPVSEQSAYNQPRQRSHRRVVLKMLGIACGMFGFGYLMVPMYDIICDITGLNGKTGRVSVESVAANAGAVAEQREVIVEFTASINASGSWIFRPNEKTMTVEPGKLYTTSYYAENLSSEAVVAQATPSVSPSAAARHFNKTECFCFVQQAFGAAGEPDSSLDMPLTFIIDEDLPANVDRVTLSYTFFRSPNQT